jgi:hypothetical protein
MMLLLLKRPLFILTSQKFQGALSLPVSFPNVIRTLTPTVTAALVNALSALRQIKKPKLTHEAFAIRKYAHRVDFCFSMAKHK